MRMGDHSLSLLDFCTLVSKTGTSSRREVNSIDFFFFFILMTKSNPLITIYLLIECLVNNHKSSCMLAYGYIEGDERLSLPHIGAE